MITSLVLLLVVTLIATWWAKRLAAERGRHVGGWALATALAPPLVLVLWLLPARTAAAASP